MRTKNEFGFTLIEMMVVLMIISILLLITIPNVTKNNSVVKQKGCVALENLIEAQVQAYEIEMDSLPSDLEVLKNGGYITTSICPDGREVQYNSETGEISVPEDSNTTGQDQSVSSNTSGTT